MRLATASIHVRVQAWHVGKMLDTPAKGFINGNGSLKIDCIQNLIMLLGLSFLPKRNAYIVIPTLPPMIYLPLPPKYERSIVL